jgi:hypothetical protein
MAQFSPIRHNDRTRPDLVRAPSGQRNLGDEWIEFRPARWLVAALTLLTLWLARPRVGARALVAVAWGFIPRRFKLIAGGAAALALIVLAGSVAALVLVLNQLA